MEHDKLVRLSDVTAALNSEGYTKNMRVHKKVLSIPAVDAVEVRHARWLRLKDGVFCGWCTFGWKFMTGVPGEVETDYRYCPHCGSRMDREEENNAVD